MLKLIVSLIRMKQLIGSKEELRKECQELSSHLDKFNSPVVYCHNDLTCQNIIFLEEKGNSVKMVVGGIVHSVSLLLLQQQSRCYYIERYLLNSFGCHVDSVTFIDLEYGGPNFRGFDIGDFFCEFAGNYKN